MKLSDIQEVNFAEKPVGQYQVEIVGIKDGITSEKGTPYSNLDLLIVDGEYSGGHLFHTIWRTFKSIGFLKNFLLAAGFNENDDIDVKGEEVSLYETQLKGRQLIVYVSGHRTYTNTNGEERKQELISMFKKVEKKIEKDDIEIPF